MLRLSCVLRYVLIGALGVSVWGADSSDELIRRVEDRYNRVRSLSVQFIEKFEYRGRQRPPEAGTLTLRKRGKMRWDYSQPAGKLFVSDGETIYLYTSADNRVEKIPVRDTEDMRAPLAFLLGHLDLKKEFRNFQLRPGDGGTWLTASAKNDRVPYENVALLISKEGTILYLTISGRDSSTMAFAFSNERLNPRVEESRFHFTIPPGAEVVDAVGLNAEGK